MSNPTTKRVIVTGASGMLGRQVFKELSAVAGFTVQGWAYSRSSDTLEKVDLTDSTQVEKAFNEFKPSALVHCAAERKPDAIGKDYEKATQLNKNATEKLARLCKDSETFMIYLSTDYVFDGEKPPYPEDSATSPINDYGRLKADGEKAVKDTFSSDQSKQLYSILRVPILYGEVERVGEGAVDVLVNSLRNSDKICPVDNVQRRFPTHTHDVARAIAHIIQAFYNNEHPNGTYHLSGLEEMSKYDMVLLMGKALNLPTHHITKVDKVEVTAQAVRRPTNAQLQNNRLADDLAFKTVHNDFAAEIAPLYSKFL